MEHKSKILIIGMGSTLLGDSAIGPRLVEDLKGDLDTSGYDFKTAHQGGWELLELIEGYDSAVIIDGIKSEDHDCGHVHIMTEDTFIETRNLSSVHDLDFRATLHFARELGIPIPDDLKIIAIEIVNDLVVSDQLSPPLTACYRNIYLEVLGYLIKTSTDKAGRSLPKNTERDEAV